MVSRVEAYKATDRDDEDTTAKNVLIMAADWRQYRGYDDVNITARWRHHMEQRRGGLRGAAAGQLKAAAKPGEFATAACTLHQQNHFYEKKPVR